MNIKSLIYYFILGFLISSGCSRGQKQMPDINDSTDVINAPIDTISMYNSMYNLNQTMQQNMRQIDTIRLTGDPDYDFASLMQVHHNGGIELTNKQIANGTDTVLVNLANKIKNGQEKEMQMLRNYTENNTPGASNSAYLKELKSLMKSMKEDLDNHSKDSIMQNNIDVDFASMMSLHHKHGRDVAKLEVLYGKDPQIKEMAEKMIGEQEMQIRQLTEAKEKFGSQ